MIISSAPCAAFGKVMWPGQVLQVFTAPSKEVIETIEGFELISQEEAHELLSKHGAHLVMMPNSFCFMKGEANAPT
ncbi:hypothetical protein ACFFLZ_06360 [Photobacterium aphoticum]|uniref:Uncharacterized protein n=1 Tax=Photobacterium aphoticum TaxID=754436 RepID=A0A0J1JIZ4_9GAMM|nr:hypothetical protein [Photobacterium aphoticum]KLV01987.1 hypothetical protein ABT58_06270 [Photobacterium aphoticum]PSU60233.1 hypothetical protein C9I90_01025 [Photobacterium aphoticum]GHA34254.1 hypothetical protein GCM10007086_04570 [Photobacterium aphoticum]